MARNVVVVLLDKRRESAVTVQELFTKYGCFIRSRLGLHEVNDQCVDDGFIILELSNKDEAVKLQLELNTLTGVSAEVVHISLE